MSCWGHVVNVYSTRALTHLHITEPRRCPHLQQDAGSSLHDLHDP